MVSVQLIELPHAECLTILGLIDDLPHPEELLAAHHSADDVAQTRSFVRACEQAVNDIKIDNPEDLVVPFQIT